MGVFQTSEKGAEPLCRTMNKEITNRGFGLYRFQARRGESCSLQKSSLATEDCIWLGHDNMDMRVFIPYAPQAWHPISEDELKQRFNAQDVLTNTRMELTREQVKDLIPILQKFVDTGDI